MHDGPTNTMTSGLSLEDFVHEYVDGPACLLSCLDGVVYARNRACSEEHILALQETSVNRLASGTGGRISGLYWRFTQLRQGAYTLCLGKAPRSKSRRNGIVKQTEGESALMSRQVSESWDTATWFSIWQNTTVPGLSQADSHAHIAQIRSVDWSNTPLGPIDSWCSALLSSLGQCLASPFPVGLAWGPDHISKFTASHLHGTSGF